MALVDNIIRVQGKAADIKRKLLFESGLRCFLLKRGVESKTLTTVFELTEGWVMSYNNYRDQMELRIAAGSEIADLLAQTSFIGYGVPDADGLLLIYGIDPSRRDLIPPSASSAVWKVYCVREPRERFEVI